MKRAPDYALRGGPGAPPRVPCAAPCRRAIENRSPASFQRPQIASRARRRHRSWSAQSVARVVQCSVVPVDERARHSNINSRTASAAERTASGLRSKFSAPAARADGKRPISSRHAHPYSDLRRRHGRLATGNSRSPPSVAHLPECDFARFRLSSRTRAHRSSARALQGAGFGCIS